MEPVRSLTDTATYFLVLGFIAVLATFGLAALGYFGFLILKFRNREEQSLDSVLLQVTLPANNEVKIDAAEQLFASLYAIKKGSRFYSLKPQRHLSFEIVARHEEIRFYVSLPSKVRDMVERQIHGACPDAEIIEVPEYNIFSKEGKVAYASLKLNKAAYYPIKVYKDLPTDPLSSITSALARMGEGEAAVVQLMIAPADGKWQGQGRGFIASTKKAEANPESAKFKVDARSLEAIENKCSKPGFETMIRIVVSAPTEEQAQSHLSNIKGSFSQFASSQNNFGGGKVWIKKAFMIDFIYRYLPVVYFSSSRTILNSEELATIFHFPNKQVSTPHIRWLYSKSAPAPANIPREGLYLGKSSFRGVTRPVHLAEGNDRRRHIYIVGKTGTGKSVLMNDLILQDIRSGKGVCLIDPHDLADELLAYIPPERAEDVIYFNPSDTDRPMGLNLLEADTEEQQHFITSAIINLMYKLYDPYKTGIIGPRFEHAVRNAMLTVMCEPGNTFIEVVRCLTDSKFVQTLLPKVKDPMVRRYWTDQIAQTADFHKSEVLDYIVSKFGRFVTNKTMRNIIGQSQSAFDFRKVMDEGKILIVNLAKGKLGEENSSFLGLVLVPRILIAAMSRADISESQRKDFFLYVDEFQNFATPDFAQILSEARKYRLNLCVANQFIGQMEDEIKNAIFGNVGTIITFQIGVTDANFIQHWFSPTFSEDDLINIDRFHAYTKTIVRGEPQPPFSMDLTKNMKEYEKQANPKVAEMIKQLSRLKFGRDRQIVEAEIAQRARL
ncbi:type IV secretory system conjugative DNA transfer family protein [Patescibacteria group bacterium]